jgi:RsiW-degrading membrane proteinase PrsW (M82 family)
VNDQPPHGAAGLGLVFAVFSGASAVGAVTAAVWAARLPRHATHLVAFLVCGAPRFVVMAFDSPLAVIGVVVVAAGVLYFAVTMLSALDPRWREMDRRPEGAGVPL